MIKKLINYYQINKSDKAKQYVGKKVNIRKKLPGYEADHY